MIIFLAVKPVCTSLKHIKASAARNPKQSVFYFSFRTNGKQGKVPAIY